MYRKEYNKKWNEENREHVRAYDRARYAKNRTPKLICAKKRYELKAEEIKAKRRAYYLAHREEFIAKSKAQKLANPQKYRDYTNKSNAKKRELKAGRPQAAFCEVCESPKRTYFDHDHSTGKFRGWLCMNCNTALGHLRDDIGILKKLINYLENSKKETKIIKLVKSPIQIEI